MWSPTRAEPSESAATPPTAGHGIARLQRRGHRRAGHRFHADHADPPSEPGRDARDQPAPADRDQHGVEVVDLLFELHPDRALPGDHLRLVERVHEQRPSFLLPGGERRLRLRVVPVDDRHAGAISAHAGHLGFGRCRGDEDLGRHAGRSRRVRDGRAEVAAGCGDHAGRRDVARQELVEGAPGLERAGVLEELELRDDGGAVQLAELEHRRPSHPAGDPLGGGANIIGFDGHGRIQPQATHP